MPSDEQKDGRRTGIKRVARASGLALLWSVSIVGAVLIGLLLGTQRLLGQLDSPRVRASVCRAIEAQTGLALNYGVLALSPYSGLLLEDVSLANPASFRGHAPELLSLRRLEVGWSLWGLIGGDLQVRPLRVEGLDIHLVVGADGRNSLDGLASPSAAAQPIAEPAAAAGPGLSQLLARTLPTLAIEDVTLRDLRAELIAVDGATVIRRIAIHGPDLSATAKAEEGRLRLSVDLTSPAGERGVSVILEDLPGSPAARKRQALLKLDLRVQTPEPGGIELALDVAAIEQDLIPKLPSSGPLASLRARLTFDPLKRRTYVRLNGVDLLQGAASLELQGVLEDLAAGGIATRIERLRMHLDASQVLSKLGLEVDGLGLQGAAIDLEVDDLRLDAGSILPSKGRFRAQVRVAKASLAREAQRAQIADLDIGVEGRVTEAGGLAATARIEGAKLGAARGPVADPTAQASAQALRLSLTSTDLRLSPDAPLGSRGQVSLTGSLDQVEAAAGARRVLLRGLGLSAETTLKGGPPLAGQLRVPLASVEIRDPELGLLTLSDLVLSLRASDVHPDFAKPAQVHLELGFDSSRLRGKGRRLDARGLALVADLRAESRERITGRVRLPLRRLDGQLGAQTRFGIGGLDLDLTLAEVSMPQGDPAHLSADLTLTTRLARLESHLDGLKALADQIGLEVNLKLVDGAPSGLRGRIPLRSLTVSRSGSDEQVLALRSGGLDLWVDRIRLHPRDLLSSSIKARLDGRFDQVGLDADKVFALKRLAARLDGRGRRDLKLGLDLSLAGIRVDDQALDAELELGLEAQADLVRPAGHLTLNSSGRGAPELNLDVAAAFAQKNHSLTWSIKTRAAKLSLLGKLLPASLQRDVGLTWSGLDLALESGGEVRELVQGFAGLSPRLASDPLASAVGQIRLKMSAAGLGLSRGDLDLRVPQLDLRLDGQRGAKGFELDAGLDSGRLSLALGQNSLDLKDLKQTLALSGQGRLKTGRVRVRTATSLGKAQQTFVAGYPLADLRLTATAVLDRLASLRIEELSLDNPAGGTHLTLKAAVDRLQDLVGELPAGRLPGRQALGLSGELKQNLGRLALFGEGNELAGVVTVPFRLESGDLKAFRLAARLDAAGVNLRLPKAGIALEGFSGQIPILEDLARTPDGSLRLVAGPPSNPYSRARFVDVHPFLKGESFLAIAGLEFMGQRLGPIAGNMRVSWDSLTVDQLQVAYKGGQIAGQLAAAFGDGRPRLFFKGNATGIHPSQSKDILDANATLDFSVDPLDLSGRIQIVRIGRQHLLDVLDWIDPYRESVDVNRARLGLDVGYPKFLKLVMQDGFLSAKIELGGVAGLVRIDEIRGIALGPLMERYVAPLLTSALGKKEGGSR